jgi:hypothetical protein
MSAPTNHPIDKQSGILALLARPFWMFFGNLILLISATNILVGEGEISYVPDLFFWSGVIAMVLVRFLDIRFLDGLTATGKPASLKHWRRYTFFLALVSAAIWSAAHAAVYLFKS